MTRRDLLRNTMALLPIAPLAAVARPEAEWLRDIYRELHIDAHFGQVPNPYEDFDAEAAADMLKQAGFQMVSCFAICNAGYCYFPAKIGVTHPGLKRDFTGEMTAALKKRGIRVLAYVSVGPDRRWYKEHPDWIIQPARSRGEMVQLCPSSPWLEQVHIPQLEEIVALYNVDGFFLDSLINKFVRTGCQCQHCKNAFRAETGLEIPTAENDPNAVAHYRWLSLRGARYADAVIGKLTATKPGLVFAMNHIWVTRNPVKPPKSVTQLVWEPVPPYSGTLSLDLSLEARYLSSQPGIVNWSCMATRGNGWGDYSLRDAAAFRHEAAVLLANGGRPYFGDDSYPSGNPDPAVYKVYGEVNRRTAALEPFVRGCTPVREIAVLLSAESMWAAGAQSSPGVAGAHKALVEEHAQFGILNSEGLVDSLSDYKVLIVPEQSILSARECDAIRAFLKAGGALIASGEAGALADVLSVRFLGRADVRRSFLRATGMDVQISGAYQRVQTTTAKTLIDLIPPNGPRQAPGEAAEGPGVTIAGTALYCAVPIFTAYQQDGTPALGRMISWMLHQVHPPASRAVVLENTPLNVEMTLNHRGADRFLHLINFTGNKRTGAQRLHDFIPVDGIRAGVRCSTRPKRIVVVPEGKPVAFEWKDGRAWFAARQLVLHDVYMIEG
jgi:hypothetical protein